jgi:subtilisin family serine protease
MTPAPSSIVEPNDPLRVTRRVELRFSMGQVLPKLEELKDLAPKGVTVVERDRREPVSRLDLDLIGRMADVAGAVTVLASKFGAQVMRDEVLPPPGAKDDPPYPDPESARRIAAPGRSAAPQHGPVSHVEPVIVAIIDSGIMASHPDLRGHLWDGPGHPPVHGRSFIGSPADVEDQDGHGTMLAGTALAGANGSPAVRFMAIKFFDARKPPEANLGGKAIKWAVDHWAQIINLSWAVGIEKPGLRKAIEYARDKGVLIVVAAGNSGADNDAYESFPASYGGDKTLTNVITVMATDDLDDAPGFSNYGRKSVHIGAPGMRVISTHSYLAATPKPPDEFRFQRYDGTSASAAYVAGAAALLKSKNQTLSPENIREILMATADDRPDLRCVAQGRLNVAQALARVPAIPAAQRARGAGPAGRAARDRAARTAR